MNIVSFSGGKDSTAMLLIMLEKGENVHSVLWFDTERDFVEILNHIQLLKKHLPQIRFITVRDYLGFDFWKERYGEAHPSGGWCTALKRNACNKYVNLIKHDYPDIIECIGFSADEEKRANKINKQWKIRFPLIEWGITEKDALEYCYAKGYNFDGIYNWMPSKRVSCYDCPKQSKKDFIAIKKYHPELLSKKIDELREGK